MWWYIINILFFFSNKHTRKKKSMLPIFNCYFTGKLLSEKIREHRKFLSVLKFNSCWEIFITCLKLDDASLWQMPGIQCILMCAQRIIHMHIYASPCHSNIAQVPAAFIILSAWICHNLMLITQAKVSPDRNVLMLNKSDLIKTF